MSNKANKRNGEIDLFRLVFAVMIMFMHFGQEFPNLNPFPKARVGVEFFFLVTGYLTARSAMKVEDTGAELIGRSWTYTLKKVSAFFGYYVVCTLITFVLRFIIIQGRTPADLMMIVVKSLPNFLLLFMGTAARGKMYVSGQWYLSVMVIATFILYPLMAKFKERMIGYVCPILGILGIGYVLLTKDTFDVGYAELTGVMSFGLLRGLTEMMLGAFAFYLTGKMDRYDFHKGMRIFLTIVKYACYGMTIYYATWSSSNGFAVHSVIYMLAAVLLSFSKATYSLPANGFTDWCGRFSLPIFIFHASVRMCAEDYFPSDLAAWKVAVLLAGTTVYALAMMYLVPLAWNPLVKFLKKQVTKKESLTA